MSSQGDDTFVVYDRNGKNKVIGSSRVEGDGVDDINGSDGLAVTNQPVGAFDTGLLVSHDEPETGSGVDPGAGRDELLVRVVGWHRGRPRPRHRHPGRQRPPVRALTDDLQVVVVPVVVIEVVVRVLVKAPGLLVRPGRVLIELVAEGGVSG